MWIADIGFVLFYWAMWCFIEPCDVVMTHPVWLLTLLVNFFLSVVMLSPSHLSECFVMVSSMLSLVLLTHAYAGCSSSSCLFFLLLLFVIVVVCALYLLCISLGEGQLGRHMEHDLLLSVYCVDRLRTSLTMWHIQTSSKPAWRRTQQSKCTNPPDLKILTHKWRMCIIWCVWGSLKGTCLTPWSPAAPPCLPIAAGSPWKPVFHHCSWKAPPQTPGETYFSLQSTASHSNLAT